MYATAFDEHGSEVRSFSSITSFAFPADSQEWKFPAFPRRGRKVEVSNSASTGGNQGIFELMTVKLPPGATRINVTFAVQKARFLEFVAGKTEGKALGVKR